MSRFAQALYDVDRELEALCRGKEGPRAPADVAPGAREPGRYPKRGTARVSSRAFTAGISL